MASIKTQTYCLENYINRKSFQSVILQAVCDSKMHLLDVTCGRPGSVHDSRYFKNSELFDRIQSDSEGTFPNNTHLLGDFKDRFRRLKYVDIKDIKKKVKVVIICCILQHEYCLQHDDNCLVYIEEGVEDEINNYVNLLDGNAAAGERKSFVNCYS